MAGFGQIEEWVKEGKKFIEGFGEDDHPKLDVVQTVTHNALTALQGEVESSQQEGQELSDEEKVNLFLGLLLEGVGEEKGLMDYLNQSNLTAQQKKAFKDQLVQQFMDDPGQLDEMIIQNTIDSNRLKDFVSRFLAKTENEPFLLVVQQAEKEGSTDRITAFVSGIRDTFPEFAALIAGFITIPKTPEGQEPSLPDKLLAKVVGILKGEGKPTDAPENSQVQPQTESPEDLKARQLAANEDSKRLYFDVLNSRKPDMDELMAFAMDPNKGFFEDGVNEPVLENGTDKQKENFERQKALRRVDAVAEYLTGMFGLDGYDVEIAGDGLILVAENGEDIDVITKKDPDNKGDYIAYRQELEGQKSKEVKFDGKPEDLAKKLQDEKERKKLIA